MKRELNFLMIFIIILLIPQIVRADYMIITENTSKYDYDLGKEWFYYKGMASGNSTYVYLWIFGPDYQLLNEKIPIQPFNGLFDFRLYTKGYSYNDHYITKHGDYYGLFQYPDGDGLQDIYLINNSFLNVRNNPTFLLDLKNLREEDAFSDFHELIQKYTIDDKFIEFSFTFGTPSAISDYEQANLALKNGQYEIAVEYYNRTIEDEKNANTNANISGFLQSYPVEGTTTQTFKNAWFREGLALDALGRYRDAITAYEGAFSSDPKFKEAWFNKGLDHYKLGQYHEAIQAFDQALLIDPNYDLAISNKTFIQNSIISSESKTTIPTINQQTSIGEINATFWYNKGIILLKDGQYQDAIDAFNNALAMNPNFIEAQTSKEIAQKALETSKKTSLHPFITIIGIFIVMIFFIRNKNTPL